MNPLKVIKPDVKGLPPPARYSHTMKFAKFMNSVIIYGGRNDETSCCYSDIFTLNLGSLTWLKINLLDSKYNEEKFSFASDLYNTRLLVFGGLNYNGFLNNELYVVEFDDSAQKRRIFEEKRETVLFESEPFIKRELPTSKFKTFLPIPSPEPQK